MKIISVVGARPNFMKIAPFIQEIERINTERIRKIDHILVHTGQHYDDRMSKSFFSDLNIPSADINLGIGSGSHAEQVGNTMIAFEQVLKRERPDWVIVVGDVNATLACSVTAKKLHIKVCHIEAGLRSGDIKMPEEINRLVTDRVSDLLLTPDRMSNENLKREGTSNDRIRFVGNIMIDTLKANKGKAADLRVKDILLKNSLAQGMKNFDIDNFAVVTMHRPSNVDEREVITSITDFLLNDVASMIPVIWPIHPRTKNQLLNFGLWQKLIDHPKMILLNPVGYHEMLNLNMNTKIMITDSGGLQEECTVLGTPCLTLRWNTERPITLVENGGASILVGNNIKKIKEQYEQLKNSKRQPVFPELWDGNTAGRCLDAILSF